ncbi:MAG: valine--tRNA ligase [Armatimonadota bacterium]|nr:valine--tRNA ligase [Armatimonadota bacterium]MDR5697488.1 valine--tRNA ligase [Armatimonadota bacterium]
MAIDRLPKAYDPAQVEQRLYQEWRERGYFRAVPDAAREPWAVMMPLPNVTGELHIGHALNNTLQDVQTRFWRMRGRNALYQPGTDHAGIATQNVVEKELAAEGLRREDLGRERFEARVWDWVGKYGRIIYAQLERLGLSCDWDRKVFTLDPQYSDAVLEAFVRLYERGLIYRSRDYMVNWCPRCRTAISDLEVEHEEVDSHLWHVRYSGADGSPGVVIATQRPETILADVAVAVHPEDERYRDMIGREVVVPIVGRKVPVIADRRVDPEFGTGALKITPGHDPTDFAIGRDHGLVPLVVIAEDGRMNEAAGEFAGLDRFEARERVAEAIASLGLIEKVEPYRTSVGRCDRCHTVIEPYITEQWFCDVKGMAARAAEAIRSGRVRFHPERWTRVALDWLDNIRPWTISRQLWWGHRIPVWTCEGCGQRIASKAEPSACRNCNHRGWAQDPDVLDTWFSSALWPFATLGWPRDTEDLRYFYPTRLLVTDRGIIFLWVCRMIMFGLEFIGEVPFADVYIHPTVHDMQGRRMSKSLGTGIDPLEVIGRHGADALRFALIARCSQSQQDMRFEEKMIADTRNFANKIWNAARFVHMNLGETDPSAANPAELSFTAADVWILGRLQRTVEEVTRAYETYRFDDAARSLYRFLWSEYCDWYLEMAKVQIQQPAAGGQSVSTTRWVLWYVLDQSLRLLHPIMPFVTEEVWRSLPHRGETLMLGPWPQADPRRIHEQVDRQITLVQDVIREIRSLRADLRLPPHHTIGVHIAAPPAERAVLEEASPFVRALARAEVKWSPDADRPHPAALGVVGTVELYVPLAAEQAESLAERARSELEDVGRELQRLERRLADPMFVARAPAEVVSAERERLAETQRRADRLRRYLAG